MRLRLHHVQLHRSIYIRPSIIQPSPICTKGEHRSTAVNQDKSHQNPRSTTAHPILNQNESRQRQHQLSKDLLQPETNTSPRDKTRNQRFPHTALQHLTPCTHTRDEGRDKSSQDHTERRQNNLRENPRLEERSLREREFEESDK